MTHRPGTQHLPEAAMVTLADQVQVELAQCGEEAVGIADQARSEEHTSELQSQ